MESSSSPLPSRFPTIGEHSHGIHKLNKKRKLPQYEVGNSGNFPWPKHKHRDRSGNLDHHSESSPDELIDPEIGDASELKSENDSSSVIGGSDNKMAIEIDSNTEALSNETLMQELSLTSFSSSASNLSSDSVMNYGNSDSKVEDETDMEEDMMLYSNGLPPFLLSSGRWNSGQDARLGTRKPTIDQEFEQYFSALML